MAKKSRDNVLIPKATTSITYKSKVANYQPTNNAVTNKSSFENKLIPVKKTTPLNNFEPLLNQQTKSTEKKSITLPSTLTNVTCSLSPTDFLTIQSDKCVTVIVNENITEQKYIKNISGTESICVGTVDSSNNFTTVVNDVSKIGFDTDTGLNVVCLESGLSKIFSTNVYAINSLNGNVTLSAGNNISIGTSGNTLTICSSDTTNSATPTTLGTMYGFNQTSYCNTYVGYCAGKITSTGRGNIAIGQEALGSSTSGNFNIALGPTSLVNSIGSNNISIGPYSGCAITTGVNNTIIGSLSGTQGLICTVLLGAGTCERLKVDDNGLCVNGAAYTRVCSINNLSGNVTLSAGNNVSIGTNGNILTICSSNSGVTGINSLVGGVTLSAGNNISIGTSGNTLTICSTYSGVTGINSLVGGVTLSAGNNISIGTSGNTLTICGNTSPVSESSPTTPGTTYAYNQTSYCNTFVGYCAGTITNTGSNNVAIGFKSLYSNNTGSNNIAIGTCSGINIMTGVNNTIIGNLPVNSGTSNTMLIATGSTERLKVDNTGLYINQSGVGSAITLRNIYEAVVSMSSATGTVVHDFSLGSIFNHTSMVSNFTVNIINLNLSVDFVTNIILILNQGIVPYIPNGLQINGSVQTINWVYGAVPTGNSAKKDIVNFSITNIGGVYTVFGQLVTYG